MNNKIMRSVFTLSFCALGAVWVLVGCGASDTKSGNVVEAGSITGKVVWEGNAPAMRARSVDADPACVKMHANDPLMTEHLLVGDDGAFANIFIQVVSPIPKGDYPVPTEPVILSQQGCQYTPHVFVVRKGQELAIQNPDAILHNIHFMPKKNIEFNKAMSKDKKEISFTPDKAESMFTIKCDVHSWMQAFCAVLDHPFYAVTGKDGKFSIDNLPPGEYEIEAWHEIPRLESRRAKVVVKDGEDTELNFSFSKPTRK